MRDNWVESIARTGRRLRGFTPVESLVVIGVIALLIAILLPALSKARYQAQIVTCQARIQQSSRRRTCTASDHKGSLPSLNTPMNGGYNLWDQSLLLYETLRERYKFPHTMICPSNHPTWMDSSRPLFRCCEYSSFAKTRSFLRGF